MSAARALAPRATRVADRVIGEPVADPAPETSRVYASDWSRFAAWCRKAGAIPLPATPATLAAYLGAVAPGLSRGALGRHRAAIVAMHRQQRQPIPVLDDAALAALRAAARPAAPFRRAARLEGDRLASLAEKCARDLAGLRDRALLLLAARLSEPPDPTEPGFVPAPADRQVCGPVPRAWLLGLDADHVRFTAEGMQLRLRSRIDAPEPDQVVEIARSSTACPVRALEDWLRASETTFGPVFRKVNRWGGVEHGRLGPDAWPRIVGRYSQPGRGPKTPSPHPETAPPGADAASDEAG